MSDAIKQLKLRLIEIEDAAYLCGWEAARVAVLSACEKILSCGPPPPSRTISPRQSPWDSVKTAALVELWDRQVSAREIAGLIGVDSRSAVLGKARRLGLRRKPPSGSQLNG